MAGAAAIAWRIAGREAAVIALLLAVVGQTAFQQFRPGRIDHHNVQIALSVLAVAATVWSDRVRWAAYAAGAVTGLALAIGLECLPYLMVCAAAFAARFVVDRNGAQAAAGYGLALASSSVVAFLAIVDPGHWGRGVCDAIAVNWLALALAGGLGLWLGGTQFASDRLAVRLSWTTAAAVVAIGLFVWIEPRCLKGPYAMMDPEVWAIWLTYVREMQPLIPLMAKNPLTAIAIATFPVAALVAAMALLRDRDLRGDFGYLAATVALIAAVATTLAAIKAHSYANWLGIPLVAAFALHLFAALRLERLVPRFAVGLLLTPAALSIGAISIAHATGLDDRDTDWDRSVCARTENYPPVARLPAGLVAADFSLGPFLLALTPHSILSAPYHRMSAGILAGYSIFAAPPDEARKLLGRLGVTYVLSCGSRRPDGLTEPALSASLWRRLQAKDVPAWLEPVSAPGALLTVYRVRS